MPPVATSDERDPVDVLAEKFAKEHRRGRRPTIAEYVQRYPEHAEAIQTLFPMVVAMEELKAPSGDPDPKRPLSGRGQPRRLGDYRIVREIGRGGMGVVFEAEQVSLGRRVAVKVLPEHALDNPKHLRRFLRESQTAAQLHHSNIVPVFGVGEDSGLHYFVMQYIRGVGLDHVIQELRLTCCLDARDEEVAADVDTAQSFRTSRNVLASLAASAMLNGTLVVSPPTECIPVETHSDAETDLNGERAVAEPTATASNNASCDLVSFQTHIPTSPPAVISPASSTKQAARLDRRYWNSVAEVGIQIAGALHYAHGHGTVHRDIKPANLLVDRDGLVWITDFGLARTVTQDNLSLTQDVVGTLRYMAPEQLRGEFDPRSDVYSLGLTLYELATLRPAFDQPDAERLWKAIRESDPPAPRTWIAGFPQDLETILIKAISREPNRRYNTAAEMADDLRRFVDDKPIRARRTGSIERAWRWSRRNPVIASLSTILMIVVATAFSIVSWKWQEAELQNARADDNLSLALDSMNEILDRLADNWMAYPIGLHSTDALSSEVGSDATGQVPVSDDSAAILQDALKFYDQFAKHNAANPRLRFDTGRAHRRVGDIRQRLGQFPEAEAAYRQALAIHLSIQEQSPESGDLTWRTGLVLNELGAVLREMDRNDEAERALLQARDLMLAYRRRGDDPKVRYELARTFSKLGSLQSRSGRRSEGITNQRQALSLLAGLVEQEPPDPDYLLVQARCYRSLFLSTFGSRNGEDASEAKASALRILENLVRDHPAVPDYQCELAETLTYLAPSSRDSQQREVSEQNLNTAATLARNLAGRFPAIPRYQACLGRVVHRLGGLFSATDRPAEAERCFVEAETVYLGLVRFFPRSDDYRSSLAQACQSRGEALRRMNRLTEARESMEAAINHQQQLVDLYAIPNADRNKYKFYAGAIARQYQVLAETLKELGEDESAQEAKSKAGWYWMKTWQPSNRFRGPRPSSRGQST